MGRSLYQTIKYGILCLPKNEGEHIGPPQPDFCI